ncbi:AMP-dependent synthetase [Methylomonas sp. LL1]|uniref:ApeI family dehydratase n=1 Tax=Methylomonas sp. LL1 TaxID=2785785 RepID=UPI0018C4147D|nr:AMP-dependent synthetase [Methylomonas sp. LL1]QPK62192.1 AMP-dependent synthetase [Methylomonas sp. LL1]
MVVFPEILGTNPADKGIILNLRIPENLAYFDGHFDQISVVPGVAQIQWAVHYARLHLGLTLAFSHMESIKFKELLLPGQVLQLELRYLTQSRKLEFCYRSDTSEYSSGRIYFHDDRI